MHRQNTGFGKAGFLLHQEFSSLRSILSLLSPLSVSVLMPITAPPFSLSSWSRESSSRQFSDTRGTAAEPEINNRYGVFSRIYRCLTEFPSRSTACKGRKIPACQSLHYHCWYCHRITHCFLSSFCERSSSSMSDIEQ